MLRAFNHWTQLISESSIGADLNFLQALRGVDSFYAHLFAQREHGEVARQALEASYTEMREVGQL